MCTQSQSQQIQFERTLLITTRNHWVLPLPTGQRNGQRMGSKQTRTTGRLLSNLKQRQSRPDNADHSTWSWIDNLSFSLAMNPLSTMACSGRTRIPERCRCVGSNQIIPRGSLLSNFSVSRRSVRLGNASHSTRSSIINLSAPSAIDSLGFRSFGFV